MNPIANPDWSAQTLAEGRSAAITRQFDPGSFLVFRAEAPGGPRVQVGALFVEPAGGANTVEHWVFTPDYRSPAGTQSVEVEKAASPWPSLSSFFAAMRAWAPTREQARYIRAECATYASLPA